MALPDNSPIYNTTQDFNKALVVTIHCPIYCHSSEVYIVFMLFGLRELLTGSAFLL